MNTADNTTAQAAPLAEALIVEYYSQLRAINKCIAARTERPYATKEENAVIRQLTATIRLLRSKPPLVVAMETLIRLIRQIMKITPELSAQILPQMCIMLFPGLRLVGIPEITAMNNAEVNDALAGMLEQVKALAPTPRMPVPDDIAAPAPPPVPISPTKVHYDGQTEAGRTIVDRYNAVKATGVKADIDRIIVEEERMSHIERFGAGNPPEKPLRIQEYSPHKTWIPPGYKDAKVIWKVVRY